MRLQKLILRNFKGIEFKEIEPNGKSINIYGANALKKTSHNDAYSWLITDKDSQNRSTQVFGIKPREVLPDGSLGEVIAGAEPEVEGVFETDDGQTLTLKKQHAERWGSNDEIAGYTTKHWFNGEPIEKSSDFKDRLDSIVSEELRKILSSPMYVPQEMSKAERRNLIVSLIDVDDQAVIDAYPELDGYLELLDGRPKSSVENILKERKKTLNKLLGTRRRPGELPARIDENQLKITDPDQSRDEAQNSIQILKENLEGKREKLSEAKSGGGVSDLNVKVQEVEADKAKYLNEQQKKVDGALAGQREKVSQLEDKIDEAEADYRQATRDYTQVKSTVEANEEKVEQLSEDITAAQNQQPDPKPEESDQPEVCPYCKQEFPQDNDPDHDPDAHYEQYLKEFNQEKAEKIKELRDAFDKAQTTIDYLYKNLKAKEQEGVKVKSRLNQRKDALEKAKAELDRMKAEQPQPDTSEFDKQQKALLEKIAEIKQDRQSSVDDIKSKITEIESNIEKFQNVIREHENNDGYRERIDELRKEIKELGAELVDVDHGLSLIEDFTRAQAVYITEKVNKKFNLVNWRMFKDNIGGGIEERCDPVYNSQPWDDLSTSEKIKCGVDIINTLSKWFGKSMPVWIDNRESCTLLPENDLQVISLVVNPQDKKLRIETADKEMAVA